MKKLGFLLGSLLVVSATATAKEIIPEPVVVVEEVPVVKEKIVYVPEKVGFKPSGYVDLQYRYFDGTEGERKEKDATKRGKDWNNNNVYSRLQLEGKVQMTENQSIDFRVRDFKSLTSVTERMLTKNDETRVRYNYNHGKLADTKIGMISRAQYKNKNGKEQSLEYRLGFEFADYLFNNDYIKTTSLLVAPTYRYTWGDTNNSNYTNTLGLYVNFENQLPYGFSTQLELDGINYNSYGRASNVGDGDNHDPSLNTGKPDSVDITINAYLYHDWNLYTEGKFSLDWHAEAGYDSFNWSNRHQYEKYGVDHNRSYDDKEYSVYLNPEVTASYAATNFVKLYATIGAEYRNWVITDNSDAKDWRWQPYVGAGFKVNF